MEAFAAWQARRGLAARTIERRLWTMGKWLEHLAPRHPLEATHLDVETFLDRYRTAQTRYSVLADLHQYYRYSILRELTDRDPTMRVEPPRLPRRLPTPIPVAEVRRAIASSTGDLRLMLMFGAFAGLRVSEIAAVRGEDLCGSVLVVRMGKGGRQRTLPMHPWLLETVGPRPFGPLFPGVSGHAVSDRIRKHFRRLGITARPHDLRHTFGTEAARLSGGNMVLVQQLMGHASVQTTERYVGWAAPGAEVVGRLFVA